MERLIKNLPDGVVSLRNNIKQNLDNFAEAKNCEISDLVVIILNRNRHAELI